jgi:hypothetical protein
MKKVLLSIAVILLSVSCEEEGGYRIVQVGFHE